MSTDVLAQLTAAQRAFFLSETKANRTVLVGRSSGSWQHRAVIRAMQRGSTWRSRLAPLLMAALFGPA